MTGQQDRPPRLIVTAERFPHGLRCGACHRPLAPGDRYAESLAGMAGSTPS